MTDGPLDGVRVVEVATHVFVPMAGAVLAEWGADVVKVEHPVTGDPYRALVTAGLHNEWHGVDPFFQSANRGKRSVGLDLARSEGRSLLARLLGHADVFTTSLRADARRRLGVEVDDVRRDQPSIVYVRGTAFGPHGPDAARGGYDTGSYWARSGMQDLFTASDAAFPTPTRPAFGDVVAGLSLAGGVAAALVRRATTGELSVVDSSLLASGMWQVQTDVVNAKLGEEDLHPKTPDRSQARNPLMLPYRTRDGRFLLLMMLTPDRSWVALCDAIGQPGMAVDPRFATMEARQAHSAVCVAWLDGVFGARDLADWRHALADFEGEWTVVQTPREVHDDPQVLANGYIAEVPMATGVSLPLVAAPIQFDETPGRPTRAPEHGEHTEEVLLELGCTWDEISAWKESGAVL